MLRQSVIRLSGLALVLLSITWSIRAQSQSEPSTVGRLSFGRVMPDQKIEQVISFSNPTNDVLEIENINLTPPLRAEDISFLILPGMEGSFKLVLGEDRIPGEFEGLIQVNFKANAFPPITFEVEGYVIPPIEFKPYAAFFVATHSGKQKSADIEIINHRKQPLLLTAAQSDSDRFSTKLETIEEGQHYRLTLILDGSAEAGKKKGEITLLTDPPMDEPLRVQANTFIRESVYTFPEFVDLGTLPLKVATDKDIVQKLSQTLMVYRPETTDFEIEASVDRDFLALKSERGPQGDRFQLTLTLIPEKVKPGKIDCSVRIETNDKNFNVLEIPVTGFILD
jgi:hypothetical protein